MLMEDILLFIIETLFFILFSAFVFQNLPAVFKRLHIADYIYYQTLDKIVIFINCLLPLPFFIFGYAYYHWYCYYYWALSIIIYILFAL